MEGLEGAEEKGFLEAGIGAGERKCGEGFADEGIGNGTSEEEFEDPTGNIGVHWNKSF